MSIGQPQTFTIDGTEITVYPTTPDCYGNPRFLVHYLSFPNLNPDPEFSARSIEQIRSLTNQYIDNVRHAVGGKRYRGKQRRDSVVFTSYNVRETLRHALAQTV